MTMKIYIASSLHNCARVKQFVKLFESHGIVVTDDWYEHPPAIWDNELREKGNKELAGVIEADILFLVQPGRNGAHCELGIAIAHAYLGYKKTIVILEDVPVEPKPFYYLECVRRFTEESKAISFIIGMNT